MKLTAEQIVALAPDESSAAAGKKLGKAPCWQKPGRNDAALWGECQGSALYQVRIALAELAYKCNCPSRKLPCKHVLGLLFLAAVTPTAVAESEPPEWVTDWLARRQERIVRRQEKATAAGSSADPVGQSKRAEQRHERVMDGLERLDLWLNDLIRNGLAGLEQQSPSLWEGQAKRLVDAQMPALANRLRRLSQIPGSARNWPEKLLGHLGRVALLSHAYRRIEELDPALQADVRQLLGWTVSQEELLAQAERVADHWLVLGQTLEEEERVRVQKSWLLGRSSGRPALVLHFWAGGQAPSETVLPGTSIDGDLLFWPSAYPQRARFATRGEIERMSGDWPGSPTVEVFLDQVGRALAAQPWLDQFLCVLKSVTPVPGPGATWLVRDKDGQALPLSPGDHWKLLTLSGGQPVDLAGEWTGDALGPLGISINGCYHLLSEARFEQRTERGQPGAIRLGGDCEAARPNTGRRARNRCLDCSSGSRLR